MKTLYVHIGTTKTGTKAIQFFCWENRKLLEKQGYCYPDLSFLCPKCISIKNGHFLLEQPVNAGEKGAVQQKTKEYQEGMERIHKLFSVYDNIVLSDEGIWRESYLSRKTLWRELKDAGEKYGFTVKIIVYLRRQDEFLQSLWNQHVKANKTTTSEQSWDDFVNAIPKSLQLDYYKKLESIGGILGQENIIVRRFEKGAFAGGSIYADFLKAIGLELTQEYHISKEERNISLSGNAPEIMRVLNGVSDFKGEDLKFMRQICHIISQDSTEKFSMFSLKECKKFLRQYRKSNRNVAEKYLEEPGTDLFDHTIVDLPKWTPDNPYMHQDMIRFSALGIISVRERNKELRKKYRKLKREVEKMNQYLQTGKRDMEANL